jgi:hypothetical protein
MRNGRDVEISQKIVINLVLGTSTTCTYLLSYKSWLL